MTKAYQSGHNKNATFTLTGGSLVVLDVTDQQFSEETKVNIIRNASLGGRTGRLAGFKDSKGTITCDFDGLVPPYATSPGIVSGAGGQYKGYINDNSGSPTFFSFYIMITVVYYSIPGEGKVTYKFDWEENNLLGTVTAPTA